MALALTFDDGPGPSTPRLLDVLGRHDARATFFLLGCNIERAPEVARRIVAEGHVVGNHTFSHARVIGADELTAELERVDAMLVALGAEAPFPTRLPYGPLADDPRVPVLAATGRTHVHWTADFEDWLPSDPRGLAARMRAHALQSSSAVLDLHDSSRLFAPREATVDAVELVLADGGHELFTVTA